MPAAEFVSLRAWPPSSVSRDGGFEKVGFIENTAMRHRWGG